MLIESVSSDLHVRVCVYIHTYLVVFLIEHNCLLSEAVMHFKICYALHRLRVLHHICIYAHVRMHKSINHSYLVVYGSDALQNPL